MERWFFVLVAICLHNIAASRLDFQADPTNLFPFLTKLLRIRCAVQLENQEALTVRNLGRGLTTVANFATENFDTLSENVTLPTTHKPTTHKPSTHKPSTHRPTTQAPQSAEVGHVISIIISRFDPTTSASEPVARVSPFDPPTASIDQGFIKVEGSTNASSDGRDLGYLEVSWDYPSEAQAAQYFCDVYALDASFHPVSLTRSLLITSSQVSTPELAGYVGQSQKILDDLQKSVSQLTTRLAKLEQDDQVQVAVLANTTSAVYDLNETVTNLKAQNIQTGSVTCPTSNGEAVFSRPYSHTPSVFFATTQLRNDGYNTWNYGVWVQNITYTGFTYNCSYTYVTPKLQWFTIDA